MVAEPAGPTPAPAPAAPRPRDTQRSRLYRAEVDGGANLGSLEGCRAVACRVVASDWWRRRFPAHTLEALPRLRPGHGARHAFFGLLGPEPTITLPRRYRTEGVVLHELVHWALFEDGVAAHGPTFARVLLDATAAFRGAEIAGRLLAGYRAQRVRVGVPGRERPDGTVRYGDDERAALAARARRVSRGRRSWPSPDLHPRTWSRDPR